jgi:small conductance mechanosensitive channel
MDNPKPHISSTTDLKEVVGGMFTKRNILLGLVGITALIVSHVVATLISRMVAHVARGTNNTPDSVRRNTAFQLLESGVYWVLMISAVLIVFTIMGVEGAAIIAVLGSILFAIGLGLQGTLGDLAAGMMIIASNIYKIGDYIEVISADSDNYSGTVKDFNIMHTRLLDDDSGVILAVPNRILYTCTVKNHSSSTKHVVVEKFIISNRNNDVSLALEVLRAAVQGSGPVLSEPPVTTNVAAVNENGTELEVRYAVSATDFYAEGTKYILSRITTIARKSLVDANVEFVVREFLTTK